MDLFTLVAKLDLDTSDYSKKIAEAKKELEGLGELPGFNEKVNPVSVPVKYEVDKKSGIFGDVVAGNIATDALRKGIDFAKDLGAESLELASSATEIQHVIDTAFGDSATVVNDWAKTTIDAYGISELRAKQYAGVLGTMLQNAGFDQQEALKMSMDLVQLTGDLASYWDYDHDTVFTKIRSGLEGESEAIDSIGVVLKETELAEYAMDKGVSDTYKNLSELEKIALRYQKIMDDTVTQQGDFFETRGSYANQSRLMGMQVDQLKTEMGGAFIPIAESVVGSINSILSGILSESVTDRLDDLGASMKTNLGELDRVADRAEWITKALDTFAPAGERTELQQNQWSTLVSELVSTMPELSSLINTNTGEIEGGTEALSAYIGEWRGIASQSVMGASMNAYDQIVSEIQDQIKAEQTALENSKLLMDVADDNAIEIGKQVAEAMGLHFDGTMQGFKELMDNPLAYDYANQLGYSYTDVADATLNYLEAEKQYEASAEKITSLTEDLTAAKEAQTTLQTEMVASSESLLTSINEAMMEVETATDDAVDNLDQSPEARANAKATGDAATAGLAAAYPAFDSEVSKWVSRAGDIGTAVGGAISGIGNGTDGTHAVGLDYVPYNNYRADLHMGEAVLTRSEAEDWRSGKKGGVTINVYQTINSEAKTAAELMEEARWAMERAAMGYI